MAQIRLWISLAILYGLFGCGGTSSAPFNDAVLAGGPASRYLYVASGACYAGGVTTSTGPANTIVRYNLADGSLDEVLIDYNNLALGDTPVSLAEYDSNNILVLVENAAGRRVDMVRKDGSGFSTYLINSTALNGVLRDMVLLNSLSLLISKSTAIEKFNSAKSRVQQGANPFVNAPAGSCATSTTLISSVTAHSSGKIVYTHAAATPNNRIGVISSTGYAAASDCLSGLAGPTTTALPTSTRFHPSGKLLVAYGSTTASSNFVYSYDFNGTTGAITNPVAVFNDNSIVNGPSAMEIDSVAGDVYVANATSTFNTIEKFNFVSNALTRASVAPFIAPSVYTRCISSMRVMQ